jgi:hypothetical protein
MSTALINPKEGDPTNVKRVTAQLRITARMYIAAPAGRLGLRGAAARRSATWPFALVGLRATSHTCDSLCVIALVGLRSTKCFNALRVPLETGKTTIEVGNELGAGAKRHQY